jgi:hypothetical protein
MLLLKLILVPVFLLLLTLAGRRWGAAVSGWLAGLPVVAGPILFFFAIEQGEAFAATAATAALAAICATLAFMVAFARAAWRLRWPAALGVGLAVGALAGMAVAQLPPWLPLATLLTLGALAAAPRLFTAAGGSGAGPQPVTGTELAWRMAAGALLTVLVTLAAGRVGQNWSGVLALFPVIGSVLAVFSHRGHGAAYTNALLSAMTRGMYSLAAFCLVVALALPVMSVAAAFPLAVAAALAVQALTGRWLAPEPGVAKPGVTVTTPDRGARSPR